MFVNFNCMHAMRSHKADIQAPVTVAAAFTLQVRVPLDEVPGVVRQLVDGTVSWQQVQEKYPAQGATQDE
jgi:hypothetical protein